jgi:hypothetical protein
VLKNNFFSYFDRRTVLKNNLFFSYFGRRVTFSATVSTQSDQDTRVLRFLKNELRRSSTKASSFAQDVKKCFDN